MQSVKIKIQNNCIRFADDYERFIAAGDSTILPARHAYDFLSAKNAYLFTINIRLNPTLTVKAGGHFDF